MTTPRKKAAVQRGTPAAPAAPTLASSMDLPEIRLEIVKVLVPQATKYGLDDPQKIIEKASQLEGYVLGYLPADKSPS